MIKATLTKVNGNYILSSESPDTDMGRRYPAASRMRKALRAALYEEVEVLDRTGGTNNGVYMQIGRSY